MFQPMPYTRPLPALAVPQLSPTPARTPRQIRFALPCPTVPLLSYHCHISASQCECRPARHRALLTPRAAVTVPHRVERMFADAGS